MEESAMKYEQAIELFEAGKYDAAVTAFVDIYQAGYMQEQILEDLYNCFIQPNEEEFRANYAASSLGAEYAVPYERLTLDFIPVTEEKYFIYDTTKQEFLGYIDFMQYYGLCNAPTFESLCIADEWDLRNVIDACNAMSWNQIYMVLENCEECFLSFLKLPGIGDYLQNINFFRTYADMERFFMHSTEAYLPKCFCVEDENWYRAGMNKLHEARICNKDKRSSRIFLSICVPSYNRGSIVLQTVRHLLELNYDYEIEIIVSNNGSIQDTEGYEELKRLPDSRLKYFEFEEGQGYASNVRKVLELAQGAYAIMTSDEDMMVLEEFPRFLTYIMEYPDAGIIFTSGIGRNFIDEPEKRMPKGCDALIAALNSNYLTGITYNMECLRRNRAIQRFDARRGNLFLEYYAHCVLAMMTTEQAEVRYSSIPLWNAEIMEEYKEEQKRKAGILSGQETSGLLEYGTIESRIEQQNTSIEFLLEEVHIDMGGMLRLIVDRLIKTYYLLGMVYDSHYDLMSQSYRWLDICMILYRNNLSLLDTSLLWYKQNAQDAIISMIDSVFMGFYKDNPAKGKLLLWDDIQEQILCIMIEYQYAQGQPLADMDIEKFTEKIIHLLA